VSKVPLARHLVARRLWRPLARLHRWLTLPLLRVPFVWVGVVRVHTWLARRAAGQRPVQLFRQSSLAYDLAAIGAAMLAPLVRWERGCREKMDKETDSRLRQRHELN
jgi:hypothetical protein